MMLPIHQGGYPRVIRLLLQHGADVAAVDDVGYTALHASAGNGHLTATKMLTEAGANVDSPNEDGLTPLFYAAKAGHHSTVRALIGAGATVDFRAIDGSTALWHAAGLGMVNALRELLSAKADPACGPIEDAFDGNPSVCNVLDVAAQCGRTQVVVELLKLGVKVCGGASRGKQALFFAAQDNHVDVMALLRDSGVVDSSRALVAAAAFGREAAVRFLLRQKSGSAYVNSSDANGRTVLYRAVWGAHPRIARWLLDAGADESLSSLAQRTQVFDGGPIFWQDTPLALARRSVETKRFRFDRATEEQLRNLEAIHRLFLRVEAVRAVSWLWPREAAKASTPVGLVLPLVRRKPGARRVLDPRVVSARLVRWARTLECCVASGAEFLCRCWCCCCCC